MKFPVTLSYPFEYYPANDGVIIGIKQCTNLHETLFMDINEITEDKLTPVFDIYDSEDREHRFPRRVWMDNNKGVFYTDCTEVNRRYYYQTLAEFCVANSILHMPACAPDDRVHNLDPSQRSGQLLPGRRQTFLDADSARVVASGRDIELEKLRAMLENLRLLDGRLLRRIEEPRIFYARTGGLANVFMDVIESGAAFPVIMPQKSFPYDHTDKVVQEIESLGVTPVLNYQLALLTPPRALPHALKAEMEVAERPGLSSA